MPNKYSHAFVLSNYESRGIIDFDRSRYSKPSSSRTHKSNVKSREQTTSSSTPDDTQTPSKPSERLRLGSSPPPQSVPELPPLHRRNSSIETQIYAPLASPTPPPTRSRNDADNGENHNCYQAQTHLIVLQRTGLPRDPQESASRKSNLDESPLRSTQQNSQALRTQNFEKQLAKSSVVSQPPSKRAIERSAEVQSSGPSKEVTQGLRPISRHSSAVVFGGQRHDNPSVPIISPVPNKQFRLSKGLEGSVQPVHNLYGRVPLSAHAFAPECPPSPPDTPASARSFSLSTSLEKPDPMPPPPRIPERSPNRTLPYTSLKKHPSPVPNANDHLVSLKSKPNSQPKLPETTTVSTATQTSPHLTSTGFSTRSRTLSMPSKGPGDENADLDALRRASDAPSLPFAYDDADLESLPSTLDFDAIPWCDHNTDPAVLQEGSLNAERLKCFASPALTRASSFDSAAPPPIALHRPLPPVFTENEAPAIPITPKKAKSSLASLSIFRSAPKAILYSHTVPGKPPIPISISRTGAPSIPALSQNYQGRIPPSGPPPRPQSRDLGNSTIITAATIEPHRKIKDERCPRTSRATNIQSQKRGHSVPPRPTSKRRSWFKTDQLDKAFGVAQPDQRRGLR